MKYKTFLGKKISNLGFGGWQLGNKEFWGPMSDEVGINLVQEAIKEGITFFDTAPGYGAGKSEELIGKAIQSTRDKIWINTKFGHRADGSSDFSEETMEAAILDSCKRMNIDYIDSVILHNPPFYILEGKTKHQATFEALKTKGIIHAWGVSIDQKEELAATLKHLKVDVIELLFNINSQQNRSLFDDVEKQNILLAIKVPLDSGWLTGKYDETSDFTGIRARWDQPTKTVRATIIRRIKAIVKEENLVPTALQFILSFNAVTTVIPGTKNSHQLHSNITATKDTQDKEIVDQLIQLYEDYIQYQHVPW